MRVPTLRVLSASVLSCTIASALAQENEITVTAHPAYGANAVVSATKTQTALDNTPKSISVLSADDIDSRPGSGGIQSLLAELPGIDYARSGGLGGQLVIRGFNTNDERGIMTIDGDRYRGRNTLQFNMIDPSSIERIEVIRGPASALYGSDAMTGVVNIITRHSHVDPFGKFTIMPKIRSLTYNSVSNLTQGRVELEGGGDGFDVMIGGVYSHASDYSTPKGKAVNSAFHYKGVDFNIGYNPSANSRFELSGRYQFVVSGRAGGIAGAPGYPLVLVNEKPIIEKYLRALYRTSNPSLLADTFEASLYVRNWKTDLYNRNFKKDTTSRSNVYDPTIYGGHITASKNFSNNNLTYGGDFYFDDHAATKQSLYNYANTILIHPMKKSSRDTTMMDVGIFVNDNWQVTDHWILDGTLRGDLIQYHISSPTGFVENPILTKYFQNNTSQRHIQLTGSVGAIYKFTPDWQVFLDLSRGFRAPTSTSLVSSSIGPTSITEPAPDLKPESDISVEGGVRHFGGRYQFSLSAYQSNYTNLITTKPISPTVNKRVNVNKAVVRGIELEGKQYWTTNLLSRYSLTYTRADDQKTGVSLSYITPLKGTLSLKYDAYNWYVEGVMSAYARKTHIDPAVERQTAGYALFDIYAGMPLDTIFGSHYADWKITAGVENLFNTAARNPSIKEDIHESRDLIGNPLYSPGRGFVIQLSGTY